MKIKITILFFLLFSVLFSFAQKDNIYVDLKEFKIKEDGYLEAKTHIKYGDIQYKKNKVGGYLKALKHYHKAYEYNPDNTELNYKIGVAYLESVQKKLSLPYLKKAYDSDPYVSLLIHWNLGRAYQYNLNFDEAIFEYFKFEKLLRENNGSTEKVNKRIEECDYGKLFASQPIDAMIIRLDVLNSEYPDYAPLISADKSMMIFTSRRKGSTGGKISDEDGMLFEDIYVSYNKNGKWTKPKNLRSPLNTESHDATVGLSPDGQKLFLYHNLDIYVSELKGSRWTKPVPLPPTINTDAVENSACISFDGKELYFIRGKTLKPETSNGDIYVSKLKNGTWGEAKKLSSKINTRYDEDGVFMHPDGRTLFFSSKGHNTMGGYDIFRSAKQEDGTWSEPENLGFPVNSPDDDLYFVMAASGEQGYYSSVKKDGKGFMDIYKIDFPVEIEIEKDSIPDKVVRLTIVKGTVSDGNTGAKLESEIKIFDNEKDELILTAKSNSTSGKYLVSLPSGKNYGMEVKKEGYLFYSDNFNIPKSEKYQEIIKNIKLYPIKKDVKVILKNIFFDFDKSTLRKESFSELNRLKKLLDDNKTMKIEISGHTDNKGSHEYNENLSKARAKAVVNYLISKGINAARLTSRGASWDEPVDTNETEQGRQNNRRVEFKIIEK
ncbi:MAG: OmpA family protein [Bacteroidales bacterium]|nr:OmpA family protein [Bacteroidales bacterium]